MPTQQITIPTTHQNFSLQVGDSVYFSSTSTSGGFEVVGSTTYNLGTVVNITSVSVVVLYDNTVFGSCGGCFPLPVIGDFIMFEKDRRVNLSSLTGYYASVNFVNNSKVEAELFSVGSEVSESSK